MGEMWNCGYSGLSVAYYPFFVLSQVLVSNFLFRKIPSRSLAEHYVAVSVHEVLFDLLGEPVCCMFMNKNDKFVNRFIGKISAYYLMYSLCQIKWPIIFKVPKHNFYWE